MVAVVSMGNCDVVSVVGVVNVVSAGSVPVVEMVSPGRLESARWGG
jgi:hypothetical protein